MTKHNRGYLSFGVLLILLGVFALMQQLNPDFLRGIEPFAFPEIFLTIGALIFLVGLFSWNLDLFPAAAIVSAFWLIFTIQEEYELPWYSWAYMWAFFPVAGGLGRVLSGILSLRWRKIIEGLDGIIFGVTSYLFIAFLFDGPTFLPPYGPAVALIVAGTYVLLRGFFKSRRKNQIITAK